MIDEVARRQQPLVVVVDLLLVVGHPAAVDFGHHELQRGEPVEHAREDQLHDAVRRVEESAVPGKRRPVRRRHRLRERHVDRQRDARVGEVAEHRVVLGCHVERAVRVAAHHEPAHAGTVLHPLDLRERAVDTAVRQHRVAREARRRVRDVLGEPVVVRLHERVVEVGVLVREHALREPRRGVQDLGVDAVFVHLLEPRRGVVAAAPDLVEPLPAGHLLGRKARARVHPEVDGIGHALEHPRVALLERLDARRAVDGTRPATRDVQRSGGSFTWLSPEMRRYRVRSRSAMPVSVDDPIRGDAGRRAPRPGGGVAAASTCAVTSSTVYAAHNDARKSSRSRGCSSAA